MKFVMILGKFAVGKMTVGQELAKITDLRLFHNHGTIEPMFELFGIFNTDVNDIAKKLRKVVYEEFAKTDNYGMITTAAWNFDVPYEQNYLSEYFAIFENVGAEIYCVELVASQDERLKRNKSENRLVHKPSLRDTAASHQRILDDDITNRHDSRGNIPFENYIKIDNTNLAPDVVAKMVKQKFNL